ncbi:MAG: PhzF family phenazine biosynthesis isomerase [Candidatus Obscuribacterales bacterium]|nr:PhzF family phenazine biosynthesis isomerase [Steroidobacteraceae bacterium]
MGQRICRLFHVDAFTRERFCGNPAVVVLDADDLTDEQMQTIAAEINAETGFVMSAESTGVDMQVRFFTPQHEVPFVGHVTIAAQYVRAKKDGAPVGKLRQLTGAGIIEVEVFESQGDCRVALTQSPPSLGPILPDHHRRQVLDALGISSPSLHEECPLQIMVKGSPRLIVGLRSPDLLPQIKPDFAELTRLTPHVGADGYFVFALDHSAKRPTTISRMFCPALGIPEDPVSGNAHGMLGVYLVTHGLLTPKDSKVAFCGFQGQSVKRPGIVEVQVGCVGKVADSVRIEGDAVIVFEAELPV